MRGDVLAKCRVSGSNTSNQPDAVQGRLGEASEKRRRPAGSTALSGVGNKSRMSPKWILALEINDS